MVFVISFPCCRMDTVLQDIAKDGPSVQEFVPVTYLLPADYTLFVEEFRRNPNVRRRQHILLT
jgi:hypothetical protein